MGAFRAYAIRPYIDFYSLTIKKRINHERNSLQLLEIESTQRTACAVCHRCIGSRARRNGNRTGIRPAAHRVRLGYRLPEETATAQGFAPQRTVFASATGDEQDCFQPDRGYLGTEEIEASDGKRDNIFYFYKHLIEAYANYCPDEVKKNAGRTLLFAIQEAGDVAKIQEAGDVAKSDYASETAILSDLVAKLGEDPYAAALAEIGLSDAPTVIAEANDAFNAVYLKRSAEERDRKLGATMKTLRPVTDDAFNELAKAINALYAANELVTKDAEKSAALEKVIDDVNAIVVRFRKTISTASSASEEEEPAE